MAEDANQQPITLTPGTPEYDAAMVAKARAANGNASPTPTQGAQRPANIPEKFWDAEKGTVRVDEMAKSYSELEKARGMQTTTGTTTTTALPQLNEPVTMDSARAQAEAEFQKGGKLSDQSYASFEKLGVKRDMVDSYIAGRAAAGANYLNAIHTAAGGKEQFDAMLAWAKSSYTPAEATAFDKAVQSQDTGAMSIAVKGLAARYANEFGNGASVRIGANPADTRSTTAAFQSKHELVKAMADPRYKNGDAAFHAEVRAKLKAAYDQKIDLGLNVIHSGNA